MGISSQIEKVYQQALDIRERSLALPIQPELLTTAVQELYFVLEELHSADEEIQQQHQALIATHQSLEIERQRYLTLFELAPDGYVVTDNRGVIYHANQAAGVLCGVDPNYLKGKPLIVFVAEGDRPTFQAQLASSHQVQDWEIRLTRRNKSTVTIAITVAVLEKTQESTRALLWLMRDITQRKQMEHQLQAAHDDLECQVVARTIELTATNASLQQTLHNYQRAERKNRDQAALINIVPDAIYRQNLQGTIDFWSQGAERLYGQSAEIALGKTVADLFEEDPAVLSFQGVPADATSNFWQRELTQQTHAGQPITVLSRRTQIYDPTGQPQAVLVVNSDITAIKQLEAQIYRTQRIESLGTLASGVAHDLTNALTPVMTAVDMLLESPQPFSEPVPKLLALIKNRTQHSADLIRRLLLFGRGESDQRILLKVRLALHEVVDLLGRTIPSTINICSNIPPDWPYQIMASPSQLQQVFMNLCINACDAMPQGGVLTLTAEHRWLDAEAVRDTWEAQPGHYVVVSVADTGTGIDPSILDQVFDPFFTTKAPHRGTGLGLSTVFSLVKNHGGFIKVASQVGVGTQFQVYLPTWSEPTAEDLALDSPAPTLI